MPLSPGLVYLALRLPRLLAPPLIVYSLKLVADSFTFAIPTWVTVAACLLSGPALLTVSVLYNDHVVRREAAARGAIVCPSAPNMRGGLGILFTNFDNMYPGEPIVQTCELLGHTFRWRVFLQDRIFTAEPDNIKAILATEFNGFEKGAEFRDVMEPLLGTGVFAADGDMFHRQMTRPFFHRERISDFDLFDTHAEHAIALCKARLREGHAVDFQDMVARFTMDTASAFLFGRDVRSLAEGLPYPHTHTPSGSSAAPAHAADPASAFAAAFQEAQTVTAQRMRLGPHWPLAEFWVDKLARPMGVVRAFLDPILAEAVERKRRASASTVPAGVATQNEKLTDGAMHVPDREVQEGESLLDHMVNYTEDHTILRDEILNITAAGRDTTACLLTFTVYMLAEHPPVLEKLRSEILRLVGPERRPTYDDFREMKYLRAVLNETLRLYCPVPFNMRNACQPTLFRSSNGGPPIYVPAGTRTPFATIVMHRRKDLWGPDALKFDPDRFLDERLHKYLTPNPFIFLPFNAGPRICLGQQFAYHEASFFLVRLLQTFSGVTLDTVAQPPHARPPPEWKMPDNDKSGWLAHEKVRPRSHLTMYVKGGLWVRLQEAPAGEAEVQSV
ncbi:cytochrome P450 [Mycena pura]|uniref:Cytochrome P450 n=1 Tax=Mycena pura TaxID=153505 RepID=A0AAD6Y020_9AGAR|nr:cytochrome P450 [Mycena pura]